MNKTLDNQEPLLMAESMQTHRRLIDWRSLSDDGLRLRCGELTAQEIRTIRAVLNAILPPNTKSAGDPASVTPKNNEQKISANGGPNLRSN